ncbi:Eco57I restriction-modification methylase domain-containing protein [Flavobacterium caeni]|uniref:site-specific DNA-methyltransferase (adenine-specific) n=1 Tax=Flavobacterium caeni TaxID=490189 RepID=A0A1G5KAM5_9FLAO|nr:DNA methyltransferase [Flavobacterium caeni]SCY97484.1 Eco57I restriction-modification methylase [Flavobacterium caeni]
MANRIQIQTALQKPYDRILFGKEVLSPVFGSCFNLSSSAVPASVQPNKSEQAVIQSVSIYGTINLEDGTEITCYEINLQPSVRIEHSKVAIQRYVRKLLTAGQIALVNFIAPQNKKVWRLTLVAKDSELTEQGIKEKTTHAKRYTYLLGPSETCKTAAERFESLSTEKQITFQALVNAFSVEKLSKAFFDEYTLHYQKFCDYLQESNFRKSVFKITIPANATKEEKDKACKPIRDFVKKLLGRIVFLYFVQKKGWMGASDTQYKDGLTDFIKQLFKQSGGNDAFYSTWLTVLFFETLNKERNNDDFKMPDGKKVKVPFLNGGLFDKEDHDEHILTFKSKLFHHPDFEDTLLTEKNKDNARGFLDFLDAFNFTVHEDSPDDHTVAVDPEMLGHIFENLLEDNKDKGAFYTPKEIVHYMCQESLTEYLTTHLSKEYTVYKEIGNAQVELFGNETKTGQLKMVEQLGDKALNRDDVAFIVKHKDISHLTKAQLKKIDVLLDTVKICDPAIGSGAFPMGLLQEIHAIKEVIAYELQQTWKPADVKENIIQNSVYGVDIEKGAVDIARLRFWLSLVVDEEKPRALPNLDYKIVVGDSLVSKFEDEIIEIDWEIKEGTQGNLFGNENVLKRQALLKKITAKQSEYFHATNKKKLAAEIRNLKIDILINQLELMINTKGLEKKPTESGKKAAAQMELWLQTQSWKNTISKLQRVKQNKEESFEHFDWKLDFPEVLNPYLVNGNAGFDIVIANPPYIDSETMVSTGQDELREYLSSKMSFCKGNWDIYIAFFDMGFHFLNQNGNLVYITPDKWISKPFGYELRKQLKKNFNKIAEAGRKVFQTAKVDSIITFINKAESDYLGIDKFSDNSIQNLGNILKSNLTEPFAFDWLFSPHVDLLRSFDSLPHRFIEYGECENACATSDAYKLKEYLKDIKPNDFNPDLHFKVINTGTISKYVSRWGISEMTYLKDKSNPTKKYKYLTPVVDKKKFIKGFNNSYSEKSQKPKIIIKGLTLLDACLDYYAEIIPGKSTLIITKDEINADDLYAILGIINSKLPLFYIKEKYRGSSYNQGVNFNTDMINNLPIPKIQDKVRGQFKSFSKYLIHLLEREIDDVKYQLMPTYFEQIIDGMVYELYFPELIKKHKREIIQHLGELPEFTDKMSDGQKMKICKTIFNRLNDREHAVRVNLFYMSSIPEIAIIEGKNENN